MSEQTPEPTPVEVEEPAENESDLEEQEPATVEPEPVEAPLEGDDAQEPQAVPEDGDTQPRTFDDEAADAEDEPDLDAVE